MRYELDQWNENQSDLDNEQLISRECDRADCWQNEIIMMIESVSFNKTKRSRFRMIEVLNMIISSVVLNSSYWRYKCLWPLIIKIEQKALMKLLFLNLSTVDNNNSSYKTMSIKWSFLSTENQSNDIMIQQSLQSDNREWRSKRRFLIWLN